MIPLFPLRLVVFPREKLNLHIFEPRYRQLVSDVTAKRITFGIVPYLDEKKIEFGTEIELLSIEKTYDDGKMDIKTRGLRIFKVNDFYGKYPDKLYPGGDISFLEDSTECDLMLKQTILNQVAELYSVMSIKRKVPETINDFDSYDIAHHIGLSINQEYDILSIMSEQGRLEKMQEHLKFLIPKLHEMEALRKKIEMNGHFKNIIPPQV